MRRIERWQLATAIGMAAVALLPFVGKAIHIDDPLFVWTARQIHAHPLNPYATTVNWYGTEAPLHEVVKNPPLAAYGVAVVAAIAGWSEPALHLGFFLAAFVVIAMTFCLARRLVPDSAFIASAVALSSPIFLVSATTLMCDVPMLALWTAAVVCWVEGIQRKKQALLAVAGVLVALAILTKYFAMALVPLLTVYALQSRARLRTWLPYLAIPIIGLLGYEWASRSLYGRSLVLDSMSYAVGRRVDTAGSPWARLGGALAFVGGASLAALFAAPLLVGRKLLVVVVGVIVAAAATNYLFDSSMTSALADTPGNRAGFAVQLALLLICGVGVLSLAAWEVWRRRDADTTLLALWIFGTFAFAAFLNWTIAARSVLPLVPAVAILVARRARPSKRLAVAVVLSGCVGLCVSSADYRLANVTREAAHEIYQKHGGGVGSLWFQGHWGFQYYMEREGGRPIDFQKRGPVKGDVSVLPMNNTNVRPPKSERFVLVDQMSFPTTTWVSTMSRDIGARFYYLGPLPFAFGRVSPEIYLIHRLR